MEELGCSDTMLLIRQKQVTNHTFVIPTTGAQRAVLCLHLFYLFDPLANQPESKVCVHGYLFPLPVALGQVPHPIYDGTAGNTHTHNRTHVHVARTHARTHAHTHKRANVQTDTLTLTMFH